MALFEKKERAYLWHSAFAFHPIEKISCKESDDVRAHSCITRYIHKLTVVLIIPKLIVKKYNILYDRRMPFLMSLTRSLNQGFFLLHFY